MHLSAVAKELVRQEAAAQQMRRLDCLLLVSAGVSCEVTARAFGMSVRAVQRWVRAYRMGEEPFAAKRKGRPRVLADDQLDQIKGWFAGVSPAVVGAVALRAELARQFGVHLSLRQCQRLVAQVALPVVGAT